MTLAEYSAWFRGFSEHMASPPGPACWNLIKERVGEINGLPIALGQYKMRDRWSSLLESGDQNTDILVALEQVGRLEFTEISSRDLND